MIIGNFPYWLIFFIYLQMISQEEKIIDQKIDYLSLLFW